MTRQILLLLALAIATPAFADVSDSGNLTIGGQGIIVGTMTVQGNAFSVGGTTFSVAGGSVTLGGRLNAAAAGIKWADGSTSTTASSGSGSNVDVTSCTTGGFGGTWTNTAFGTALTTATFTASGTHKVRVTLNASVENSAQYNSVAATFLQDGAFVSPNSSTVASKYIVLGVAGGSGDSNINFDVVIPAPSAGSHSYALVMRVGGGTGSFTGATLASHQFCVEEVP